MFGRDKLQYMIFKAMPSTAPKYADVPVEASTKVKLVGFVEAKNSIEACELAINAYGLYEEDILNLSACLIDVEKDSFYIHRRSREEGVQPYALHPKKILDELDSHNDYS